MIFNYYIHKLKGTILSTYEIFFILFVIIYSKVKGKRTLRKNLDRLRILQYSEAYTVGGVLNVVERLSLALGENKKPEIEQCLILIDKPEIKAYFNGITQNNSGFIKTRFIKLPSTYFSFKEFYQLKTLIKKGDYDIAHIHLYAKDSCRLGIFAASMAGLPVITTEHLTRENKSLRRLTLKRLSQFLINRIIVLSDDAKEDLIRDSRIKPSIIEIIPNGVDLNRLCGDISWKENLVNIKSSIAINNSTTLVGNVSAFFPRKGHRFLLKAANNIINKHPNTKFIFIGKGNLREEMIKFARDLGLARNVEFLEWVEDIYSYYSIFDIFVFPTLAEGMPLAIIEAMATGVPVVTTSIGGNKELVIDGVTGLLIPPQNVTALANAIEYLLENPAIAREMGNAGKKRIEKSYDIVKVAEKTIGVYRDCLHINPYCS